MTYTGVTVVPTISSGVAYTSGDALGGKLEFENALSAYSQGGTINRATIKDRGKQNANLVLVLFKDDFTATADNAAFTVSDADLDKVVGVLSFPATNYISFADNSIASLGLLGLDIEEPFKLSDGETTLYGQLLVNGSTPTYTSTTDIRVCLLIQD